MGGGGGSKFSTFELRHTFQFVFHKRTFTLKVPYLGEPSFKPVNCSIQTTPVEVSICAKFRVKIRIYAVSKSLGSPYRDLYKLDILMFASVMIPCDAKLRSRCPDSRTCVVRIPRKIRTENFTAPQNFNKNPNPFRVLLGQCAPSIERKI